MTGFESFAMLDWSGGNDTGPTPKADAIWLGVTRQGHSEPPRYLRNRLVAEEALAALITEEQAAGRRLLIGVDFPFGYPKGFTEALTGSRDPFALWAWLSDRMEDTPKTNNRFDLAGEINRRFGGAGPFWCNALKRDIEGLPRRKDLYDSPFPERRACEIAAPGAFPLWQLAGAGAVGSQTLMGLPVLERLRRRFDVAVWPFEPLSKAVAFVEIWPSLIADTIAALQGAEEIKDAAQVRIMAAAVANLSPEIFKEMLSVSDVGACTEEGWIFGLGNEAALAAAAQPRLAPPPLRNDCFALPPGVDWTPVDTALDHLRQALSPVVATEQVPVSAAAGRVVAAPVAALRANPPQANSAVDGYGFAGGVPEGEIRRLPLVAGRAAAGAPFEGRVPLGHAIRILTGAALPQGVDTVVLEEDVTLGEGEIAFRGRLKPGANARAAGEDVQAGAAVFEAGHRIGPADMALLSAIGVADLQVYRPLRVALLSTGDELVEPGAPIQPGQIADANRPMLRAMAAAWGFEVVDLGIAQDRREAVAEAFDIARAQADVLLTSGGASAGDEDHVSALLRRTGTMDIWRIAVKPGRPLALGLWDGMPVFGLPGNPVAAMVCAAIFARPALCLLSGQGWQMPQGIDVPAAFSKAKKPGRREYLRARVRNGAAEVFASEGSGRISGLSWAEGLVELPDGPKDITPGTPVIYYPWGSFGL